MIETNPNITPTDMSTKYPNGYLPKIEYWTKELNAAVFHRKEVDLNEVQRCMDKLEYFKNRQQEVYGSEKSSS